MHSKHNFHSSGEPLRSSDRNQNSITHTFPPPSSYIGKSTFTCRDQRVLAAMPVFKSSPVEISAWDTSLKFAFGLLPMCYNIRSWKLPYLACPYNRTPHSLGIPRSTQGTSPATQEAKTTDADFSWSFFSLYTKTIQVPAETHLAVFTRAKPPPTPSTDIDYGRMYRIRL